MAALRFFTVYGPFGRPDMAYFSFTDAIFHDRTLTVYNEGKMARDFTYIDDITDAILSLVDKEFTFEIFNLGNNRPETVLKLISILESELKKKAKLQFVKAEKGEVPVTFADITKAEKMLGYNPKTTLEEGIRRFAAWYLKWQLKSA